MNTVKAIYPRAGKAIEDATIGFGRLLFFMCIKIHIKVQHDSHNVFLKLYLSNTSFFLCVVISV